MLFIGRRCLLKALSFALLSSATGQKIVRNSLNQSEVRSNIIVPNSINCQGPSGSMIITDTLNMYTLLSLIEKIPLVTFCNKFTSLSYPIKDLCVT